MTTPAHPLRSVLLVDDDEDIRDSLALVLRDEGYLVETACNGKEALNKLDSMPTPCVVLLDLMMPVMNGWKLLEHLEQRPHRFSVVVVSAAVPPAPAGCAGCLRKPIDLNLLLSTVEEACRAPAQQA